MSITIIETQPGGSKLKFTLDQFVTNMKKHEKKVFKDMANEIYEESLVYLPEMSLRYERSKIRSEHLLS